MVAYAWKPGTPGAWKGGALKVGSWGPESASSAAAAGLQITFTGSPLTITAGQTVTFDFYVSGSAVRVELDADNDGNIDLTPFGAPFVNTSASGGNIYTSAGTYTVRMLAHDTTTTVESILVNYITVLPSALGALGGGAGGLSFDMHGGVAGRRTSRSATAFGIRRKRTS